MENTCILIHGSSLYSSLLEPYLILLRKYWNDCSFPVFVNIDKNLKKEYFCLQEKYNVEFIISDIEPNAYTACDRIYYALQELEKKFEYVIFTLDDNFLCRKMNNDDMKDIVKFIDSDKNVGCISLYRSSSLIKNFYKKMKYRGFFENNKDEYFDNLCGHCLDKLYISKPLYLPHLEAGLRPDFTNSPNVLIKHKNKNYVNFHKINHLNPQPRIWNLKFFKDGLDKLVNPCNKLKILKEKEKKNCATLHLMEIFGAKYNKHFNLFTSKLMLEMEDQVSIYWQGRWFCGSSVNRGKALKWVKELFEENNIKFNYFHNDYVIDMPLKILKLGNKTRGLL